MQTLATHAERERGADSKNVFWIAELTSPEGLRRFCSRPLALGAAIFEPRIIGLKSFTKEMDGEGFCGRSSLYLEIFNGGEDSIQEIAERHSVENMRVRLSVLFMDERGDAASEDIIWLGDFKVCAAEFLPSMARLTLLDPLAYFGGRPILRMEDGAALPLIFGLIEQAPLRLISPMPKGLLDMRLDGELAPEDAALRLNNASGLPLFGALQVGDEVMMYGEIDEEARTVGSPQSPLLRPHAGYHSNGAPVRFIPEGGLAFLAADHVCRRIANIRANGFPVENATISIEKYCGRDVSVARLPQWKCIVRHAAGSSQIIFDGARTSGAWIPQIEDEAGTGRAVDDYSIATSALLNEKSPRLSLRFAENLSGYEKRLGVLTRAFFETHYLASRTSGGHTVFKAGVKKNGISQNAFLLFPEDYFSDGAVGNDSALPILVHRLDITEMALGGGDWDFFCGGANAPIFEIEFAGANGFARIADVSLILEYRPRVSETILDAMTADVEGLCAEGNLARNPAEAVRLLLTSPDFMGLPADAIDKVSFQKIHAKLDADGIIYDARINRQQTILNAIAEILKAGDFRIAHEADGVRFLPALRHPAALGETREHDFEITSALILNDEPPLCIPTRGSASLGEVCVRLPLAAVHLERGDRIRLMHEASRLNEAFGEIARWSLAEPDCIELGIRLICAGAAVWRFDDETLLWRQAFQPVLIFYIRGRAVARLEADGNFAFLGEAREGALEEQSLEQSIVFDAKRGLLYFGAGEDGNRRALFALDAGGNLLTRGEVWEYQHPPAIKPADYIQSLTFEGEDVLNFSLDLKASLMTAYRTSGALRLTGEIIENKS